MYKRLLGDGSQYGVSFSYVVQEKPEGLAQAFLLGREFIGQDPVALVLGDNIFYGANLSAMVQQAAKRTEGATVFAYYVDDPQRYGVVDFDEEGRALSIEEKPAEPKSNWAVTGLYFYDNSVIDIAASIRPSKRGELEITDVNQRYLDAGKLQVERMGRGYAWLDTGTHDSLLDAGEFVRAIQQRQGLPIACLEEVAFLSGFIGLEQLEARGHLFAKTAYGQHLLRLARTHR
jgi:glucose-1-phosphate thymidylyltransferase